MIFIQKNAIDVRIGVMALTRQDMYLSSMKTNIKFLVVIVIQAYVEYKFKL